MAPQRIELVDLIRSLAIILMVLFHLGFDLWYFRFWSVDFLHDWPAHVRFIIVSLFLVTVGMSLVLAHAHHIHWAKFWRRLAFITANALLISAVTLWFIFPEQWIYFGILHMIALSSLVGLLFIHHPTIALITGMLIIGLHATTTWFNVHFLFVALQPLLGLPDKTQDIARFIPWFGVVLIGIWLIQQPWFRQIHVPAFFGKPTLLWIGRHALIIYMTHQVVLYGLVWILYEQLK